jgi:hypothetical protein
MPYIEEYSGRGARPLNLLGKTYGRLTVIVDTGRSTASGHVWRCLCACGQFVDVSSSHLLSGNSKSCGCSRRRPRTHGLSNHPLYHCWCMMNVRCRRSWPRRQDYYDRGIRVCPEWQGDEGLKRFIKHVETHLGPKPTPQHSLDRIDNDRGYCPGNVRWATRSEQQLNKRPPIVSPNEWTERGRTRSARVPHASCAKCRREMPIGGPLKSHLRSCGHDDRVGPALQGGDGSRIGPGACQVESD